TGMMTLVGGVIAVSTASGSMHKVSASMSTSTGLAPTCSTTLAVAAKVRAGTITSSPGPTPSATRATWSPAVHELSIREVPSGAPTYSPQLLSDVFMRGQVVIQSLRSVE